MSRGPLPSRGFDAAFPIAKARGHVECFRRRRGSTADLMISGNGVLAIVRIVYAQRLYGTLLDVALEFSDAIARLRTHPHGGPVSRELWLYSRHGVLRFFRVEDAGIMEIGADGKVLESCEEVPVKMARASSSGGAIPVVGIQPPPEGCPEG